MPTTSEVRYAALADIARGSTTGPAAGTNGFREMIDLLPVAIYTTDAEGVLTHFNHACVAFSGRTPIPGSDQWSVIWKMYHPDGTPMPHDECPMANALRARRPVRGEVAIAERPDGSRIWFEPYPTPIFGADGGIAGGINMLVDITGRKQAEDSLLAREREARREAEALNDVARAVSGLDLESVVQKATDAATELTGAKFGAFFYNVTNEQGESYQLYTLSGAPREAFEKLGLPRNTQIFGPTFRGEGVVRIGDLRADPRYGQNSPYHGLPPGHLPVRSYLAVPVISSSGEVLGGLFFGHPETGVFTERAERVALSIAVHAAIAIDNARLFQDAQKEIAQRTRVEKALRERERQFASIFNQTTGGFAQTDLTGRFTLVNERYCQIVGRSRDQLLKLRMQDITHPDDLPGNADKFRALVNENGPNYVIEKRYLLPDGSSVWVHNDVAAIRDDRGNVLYVAAAVADITEHKESEKRLLEADRRKNEFLATLSHELRNPLAPIRNSVKIMRLPGIGGEVAERARETIERQVAHLVRLVDDLLDISRISRDKFELRKERVALAVIVQSAVETSRPLMEASSQDLTVRLPSRTVWLNADLTRMAQAVANLLNNAAKFTPEHGRILLSAEQQGQEAVLRVRDTGIGIPEDMLPHIFEMFRQVDTSHERSQGGLGIGLTLVKNLVEMHDGTVEAHCDGPGKGSEFVVRLPIIEMQPQASSGETGDGYVPTTSRRILVVDDNRDSADSLAMLLSHAGHDTHAAYDGAQAIETAAALKPDVILLDIGMPKLNGYEVARRIREQPWGGTTVLIALTGWGQDEDRSRSQAAGFHDHLVKPVEYAALTKILDEL